MGEPDKQKAWNDIIKFFNDLIEVYNWEQELKLELVKAIKLRGFWQAYYPFTSHAALCLSNQFTYDEVCENPLVGIGYESSKNKFIVTFHTARNTNVTEKDCGEIISESDFKQIEDWLS